MLTGVIFASSGGKRSSGGDGLSRADPVVAGSSPVALAKQKSREPKGLRLLVFLGIANGSEIWGQFGDTARLVLQTHCG